MTKRDKANEVIEEHVEHADASDDAYYLVNPRGAIHVVGRELARERLRSPQYRLATASEVERYRAANGNQRWDRPLAEPWQPQEEG